MPARTTFGAPCAASEASEPAPAYCRNFRRSICSPHCRLLKTVQTWDIVYPPHFRGTREVIHEEDSSFAGGSAVDLSWLVTGPQLVLHRSRRCCHRIGHP